MVHFAFASTLLLDARLCHDGDQSSSLIVDVVLVLVIVVRRIIVGGLPLRSA